MGRCKKVQWYHSEGKPAIELQCVLKEHHEGSHSYDGLNPRVEAEIGTTLRDKFAIAALAGLLPHVSIVLHPGDMSATEAVKIEERDNKIAEMASSGAYKIADAMIKERDK